jgi:hypothetical protein
LLLTGFDNFMSDQEDLADIYRRTAIASSEPFSVHEAVYAAGGFSQPIGGGDYTVSWQNPEVVARIRKEAIGRSEATAALQQTVRAPEADPSDV